MYGNQAKKIISLQRPNGSWGFFHTLGKPSKQNRITTEQALRRLKILGLTKNDEPIEKALVYMKKCLANELQLPDRREKVINWDAFQSYMLAAWIKIFEPEYEDGLKIASFWAKIATDSFQNSAFNEERYTEIYRQYIPALHKGERVISLAQFYMVNLLQGMLDKETEAAFVDYIINKDTGIAYVYGHRIMDTPAVFSSKRASQYLGALECLAGYACAGGKLSFALAWLYLNRNTDGQWDMGSASKDGVYFPISDSWRNSEARIKDCTERIERLIERLQNP